MKPFDYENCGLQGVKIIAVREPLHSLCNSDEQVDQSIQILKDELDRVAKNMKSALKKNHVGGLGLNVSK